MNDIKVIYHNAGGINNPDDKSYPWKLVANLRPSEFMAVAFIMLHGGTEQIIVRGMTKEALEKFANENNLYNHPRLRELNIYQDD